MTDSKTPGWAREAAQAFHDKWETGMSGAAFRDLAKALSAAEQRGYERGRKEGVEEAAKVADRIGKERSAQWSAAKATGKPMQSIDVGYVGYAIRQLLEVKG